MSKEAPIEPAVREQMNIIRPACRCGGMNSLPQSISATNPYSQLLPCPICAGFGYKKPTAAFLPDTAELKFRMGRSNWNTIRDLVNYHRWKGHKIEMFEGRGFLSRNFAIRGDYTAVKDIYDRLKAFEGQVTDPPAKASGFSVTHGKRVQNLRAGLQQPPLP